MNELIIYIYIYCLHPNCFYFIQLCEDDGLPRLICKDCSRQLKRTYIFNIQCEESDKKLRYYLLKATTESNVFSNTIDKDSNVKIEDVEKEYKINVNKIDNEQTYHQILLDPMLQKESKIKGHIKSGKIPILMLCLI